MCSILDYLDPDELENFEDPDSNVENEQNEKDVPELCDT